MNFTKISPRIFILQAALGSYFCYGQLGVNTSSAASSLHIEASNPAQPTASDGVLIPRISQLPERAQAIGQMVYLHDHIKLEDGFYIWDGKEWDIIVTGQDVISQDESIITVNGNNNSPVYTSSTKEIPFNLDTVIGKNKSSFTIKDDQLKIGKSGNYLIGLTSSIKTITTGGGSTKFKYIIKVNDEEIFSGYNTITTDELTAGNVMLNTTAKLNKNDIITVFIKKIDSDETVSKKEGISYSQYGNNSLKLTFLQD